MDEQYWILCEQCQPLKNRICQISANSVKILNPACQRNSVECQSLFSFRVTEFRCPAPLSALNTVEYCASVVTAVAKNWCRCGASQEEQGHCSGLGNLWCCVCSSPRTASGTVQYCPKAKEWRRVARCSPGIGAPRIEIPCGRVTDTWTLPHSWAHMSEALLAAGSTIIARCSTWRYLLRHSIFAWSRSNSRALHSDRAGAGQRVGPVGAVE
jgi:hypothetical protein